MTPSNKIYWNSLGRYYNLMGSPLRPGPEDIRAYEEAVAGWHTTHAAQPLRALLCGVTRDIATMRWPAETQVLAVDQSEPMIEAIWPGDVPGQRRALQGNWLDLPCEDGTIDVALGDGSFNCLGYPDGYRALAASLHRVLQRDGLLAIRVYVRPAQPEDLGAVFDDLLDGRIANFHACKWRIAMAIQPDIETGLYTREVLRTWREAGFDHADLAARLGWRKEEIDTILLYEGTETCYSFPTLDELRAVVAEAFVEEQIHYSSYPLGERCPFLTLRPHW